MNAYLESDCVYCHAVHVEAEPLWREPHTHLRRWPSTTLLAVIFCWPSRIGCATFTAMWIIGSNIPHMVSYCTPKTQQFKLLQASPTLLVQGPSQKRALPEEAYTIFNTELCAFSRQLHNWWKSLHIMTWLTKTCFAHPSNKSFESLTICNVPILFF